MASTVIRGLPVWLFHEYLEQLGGQSQPDGAVHGAGWQARLTPVEDFALGSLRVGQVLFELSGEAEAVESLRRALESKLMRGGG